MRITSHNFDEHAREYVIYHGQKQVAEAGMKELKGAFVAFLRKHGSLPPSGKKSLAFVTELYEAMAKFGQTTVLDDQVVERFRQEFNRKGRAVTLSEIFESRVTYVVMPAALESVGRLPKKLQRLFAP